MTPAQQAAARTPARPVASRPPNRSQKETRTMSLAPTDAVRGQDEHGRREDPTEAHVFGSLGAPVDTVNFAGLAASDLTRADVRLTEIGGAQESSRIRRVMDEVGIRQSFGILLALSPPRVFLPHEEDILRSSTGRA